MSNKKNGIMDTELKLIYWREGQTNAERLAANLLDLDGFTSIDPQCPLGGPDGIKDLVCEKNGWKYIGAAYFPTTEKEFKDSKEKFEGDLVGVAKNKVDGIVFITNQKLTPGERNELTEIAERLNAKAIIYHRERIRILLDGPQGFALRLEYLGIEMSKEEQLSFFSEQRNYLKKLLSEHSDHIITALSTKLDSLSKPSEKVFSLVQNIYETTQNTKSFLEQKLEKSDKKRLLFPKISFLTESLTVNLICQIHKAILFETNTNSLGEFRKNMVWIGGHNSQPDNASYVPPEPSRVNILTEKLLNEWNQLYPELKESGNKDFILTELAKFHYEFLAIHPFLDGNGRIARFLLTQQASELLNIDKQIILEDRAPYFQSLSKAQKGDIEPLKRIISQAIFGIEQIK